MVSTVDDRSGVHQARLNALGVQKRQGSYYTPDDVVDGLLRLCLDPIIVDREAFGPDAVASIRVLDPTCGTGNFLTQVVDRVRSSLIRLGLTPQAASDLAVRTVAGVDLDAEAVEICRAALALAAGTAAAHTDIERQIRCADSLVMPRHAPQTLFAADDEALDWQAFMDGVGASDGFDVVIGNPPFLNQLERETTFAGPYLDAVKDRFGDAARGYTDPAALFLLVGLDVLKPDGGRLCLVEPLSVLSSRGATGVRQALLSRGALSAVWFAEERVFDDADVDVWAPVLEAGSDADSVAVFCGRDVREVESVAAPAASDGSWGRLLASRAGVPTRHWATAGTIGDIASATADFRDQYYGLADHVVDRDDGGVDAPKLVTSGLIDPALLLWGARETTFNRMRYKTPRVEVSKLSEDLRMWARKRLVPKVLVATQTKVLEPVVDVDGVLLPSVPVISVEASVDRLWHIAAVLVSPPIAAIAALRHLGAALSANALKLSARDVLALPTPAHAQHWDAGAVGFERASNAESNVERQHHLVECARAMCAAFGAANDDELMQWWLGRLPQPRADCEFETLR